MSENPQPHQPHKSTAEAQLAVEREKLILERYRVRAQERQFEIAELRKEILQHETLATQIVNWTAGGALACAAFAWSQPADSDSAFKVSLVGALIAWIGLVNDLVRSESSIFIGTYIARRLEPDTLVRWESYLLCHRLAGKSSRLWMPGKIWEGGRRTIAAMIFYGGSLGHACWRCSSAGGYITTAIILFVGLAALFVPWWQYVMSIKRTMTTSTKELKASWLPSPSADDGAS